MTESANIGASEFFDESEGKSPHHPAVHEQRPWGEVVAALYQQALHRPGMEAFDLARVYAADQVAGEPAQAGELQLQ